MPLGGAELLILLAIVLLFFGAKRVPQLARSLGRWGTLSGAFEYLSEYERERLEVQAEVLAKHASADECVLAFRDRFTGWGAAIVP